MKISALQGDNVSLMDGVAHGAGDGKYYVGFE